LDRNQNDKYELKQRESLNGLWLAYYGRLAPGKGIRQIAELVAELGRLCTAGGERIRRFQEPWFRNFTLLVAGGGIQSTEVKAELLSVLPDRTVLAGWSEPSDVFSAADMSLCMSEAEGGPLTVPESIMGCCPVASYPIGVVPELTYTTDDGWHQMMYTPLVQYGTCKENAARVFASLQTRTPAYKPEYVYRDSYECSRMFSLRTAVAEWSKMLG
jgi:hypothetical protein